MEFDVGPRNRMETKKFVMFRTCAMVQTVFALPNSSAIAYLVRASSSIWGGGATTPARGWLP